MNLPLVTVILFCFNQERTVGEAALSCLQQDYDGPLEIIFSDDCSTDETCTILQELAFTYQGKHTVRLRRNPVNLGIGGHYNVAITEAQGDLVFTAAGDDISLPQRVSTITSAWLEAHRIPDLITSNLIKIDENGIETGVIDVDDLSLWDSPEKWMAKRPYVIGAAHAFTRRMHERFGNFISEVVYEDQIMAFRMTLGGGGVKVGRPLVKYRFGGVSQLPRNVNFGSKDYLVWSYKKFFRQAAQYAQIKLDLERIGHPEYWRGKIRRRHAEAMFVLSLHGMPTAEHSELGQFRAGEAGFFFRLRLSFLLRHPTIAARMKVLGTRSR